MNFYSPLRYPGGKQRFARFVAQVCDLNAIHGHYVEPYAGGASVALHLLIEGKVKEITINDYDPAIYAFWYAVRNSSDALCEMITATPVTVAEWRKQKEVQKQAQKEKGQVSLLELGFSTLFLNRTNVSGILNAGPIGGVEQKGDYDIACRFNKEKIIQRIQRIAKVKKHIHVCNEDALKLINKIVSKKNRTSTIFYFDPPYYLHGSSLYMNHYEHDDHAKVAQAIQSIKGVEWIVSYDDVIQIQNLYEDYRPQTHMLWHTARNAREGKEALFFSKGLIVPNIQEFAHH